MATTTTNLGLTKPATSDKVDVLQLNGNFDILDSAVNGSQGAIAIMANGNTHVAIASGQFVYVRKHSSLSEGLYTATAAIAASGALSSSNLSAVSGGGLNALLGKIPEQLIHLGTETDYPLSAAHTAYPFGVTLIYTASSTSYEQRNAVFYEQRQDFSIVIMFPWNWTSSSEKKVNMVE